MLANAGGPAWQMHLLPQKIDKLAYVGTDRHPVRGEQRHQGAGLRHARLHDRREHAGRLRAACRSRSSSNYAGIWLVRRTSNELFFRIAYVLMFLIAVELMRSSILVELWGG